MNKSIYLAIYFVILMLFGSTNSKKLRQDKKNGSECKSHSECYTKTCAYGYLSFSGYKTSEGKYLYLNNDKDAKFECITPNSKSQGKFCYYNYECSSGKCWKFNTSNGFEYQCV